MKQEDSKDKGIFINGKEQAIALLQALTPKEKERILKHIKVKNPTLASELTKESISFNQIDLLNKHEISLLLNYVSPAILGIALKNLSISTQRRILTTMPRAQAEAAYETLTTPLMNEERDCGRAQAKVKKILATLKSRGQIESF